MQLQRTRWQHPFERGTSIFSSDVNAGGRLGVGLLFVYCASNIAFSGFDLLLCHLGFSVQRLLHLLVGNGVVCIQVGLQVAMYGILHVPPAGLCAVFNHSMVGALACTCSKDMWALLNDAMYTAILGAITGHVLHTMYPFNYCLQAV